MAATQAPPYYPDSCGGASTSDLHPTPKQQQTLSALEMGATWVSLIVNVPNYYLAGSLFDLGMSWWQGIATVVAANSVIAVCLVLAGHPGAHYGIPFPVLARSAFGVHGSHIATLIRSLIGCGWFSIESWIGGEAIFLLLPPSLRHSDALSSSIPWLGTSPLEFACFVVFLLVQLLILWKGMAGIRFLQKYSAPVLVLLLLWLFGWACVNAGGFGSMLAAPPRLSPAQFWVVFFPCLTANLGSWSTLALSISDFTRFARSQTDQILGQVGLPIFMGAYAFTGLAITSSTEVIFGRVISNPVTLLEVIDGGIAVKIIAIFGISLATISTNIAANVVAPANSLVNVSPSVFSFRTAAMLTTLVGVVFQPWRILQSSESFVYRWLDGSSGLLAPVGAIILVDYYLLCGKILDVDALYSVSPFGAYYYCGGFNLVAVAALVVAVGPVIPGFLNNVGILREIPDAFVVIYDNAWFISFFSAGVVFWLISHFTRLRETKTNLSREPLLVSSR